METALPSPAGLRKPKLDPGPLGARSSQEAPRSKPQRPGRPGSWGWGGRCSWGSGLGAACSGEHGGQRGGGREPWGAGGFHGTGKMGNLSLSLLGHLLLVPSRASFWAHNDLLDENFGQGLPCSGTAHPPRPPQPFIQAP